MNVARCISWLVAICVALVVTYRFDASTASAADEPYRPTRSVSFPFTRAKQSRIEANWFSLTTSIDEAA